MEYFFIPMQEETWLSIPECYWAFLCESIEKVVTFLYRLYLNVFVYIWTILKNYKINAIPVLTLWMKQLFWFYCFSSVKKGNILTCRELILSCMKYISPLSKIFFFSCRKWVFSFWCTLLSEVIISFTGYLFFETFFFSGGLYSALFQWKIQDAVVQDKYHLCSWCQMLEVTKTN